jgi:carboxyl-terminal processing protease
MLEGSPAERAGLKYGDEILSVDGLPYTPIAVFRGRIGATVELAVRRISGADPQRLDVSVVPIRPTTAFSAATKASARVVERNGSRIGYVHIWASSESNTLKNALTELNVPKPLDFLIVDMRGRVGGNFAVAGQFLDLLDATQKPYWGESHFIGRSNGPRAFTAPQYPPFRGRSALLIDHHTRSAAEIMAYGYKRSRFGTVVGTPSAGAVSSGALFVMPGDLLLYVAVSVVEFDGQRLEGVGVTPDHLEERPLPYAAGADPVLDAAVEVLSKPSPQ